VANCQRRFDLGERSPLPLIPNGQAPAYRFVVLPLSDAIDHAAAILGRPEVADRWAEPSCLPGYTVGGLAGHLVRAIERTEETLDQPQPDGAAPTPAEWYGPNRLNGGEVPDELARFLIDDGERAAQEGHGVVLHRLLAARSSLLARLAEEPSGRGVVSVRAAGPVPLADYVATRIIEALVHADDLAVSAGIEAPEPPREAARIALQFLLELARGRCGDVAVLRAFSRADRVDDPAEILRVL
jgi:uncharacterized protein (TIGR03083 family)